MFDVFVKCTCSSVILHQKFQQVHKHLVLQHQFLQLKQVAQDPSLEAPQFIFIQLSHDDLMLAQVSDGITWQVVKGGAYN